MSEGATCTHIARYGFPNGVPCRSCSLSVPRMQQLVRMFPDIRVHTPYPIQFGDGDWITVVTNVTGTFTGAMTLPNGTVIAPTGKAFDLGFAQTSKWDGDQLIVISAFWDAALQAKQAGLPQ